MPAGSGAIWSRGARWRPSADVWAALFPAALPASAPAAEQLSREVAWVRVLKARVPAFDALDAGDLVIVPATVLAVVAPGGPSRRPGRGAGGGASRRSMLARSGGRPEGEPREPADGAARPRGR